MKYFTLLGFGIISAGLLSAPVKAALVGQWTFEGANPLADSTGNFPDLQLKGDASIQNGQLNVNGSGTTATGWAVSVGNYTGPTITNKTMVSWLTLESLYPNVYAGSALTIDRQSEDQFDAIVYSEREPSKWMAGSSFFARTQDFSPGFEEASTGTQIQLAISYENIAGNQMAIKGYRNGTLIGSYTTANPSSWTSGDAEVFFGLRHGSVSGGPGALDALIQEGRIYDTVLSQSEIQALKPVPGPLPVLGGLGGFHASRRLRQRIRASRPVA